MKKIAIAMDDGNGLKGQVSQHFGRCPFYTFVDLDEENNVIAEKIEQNPFFNQHQPGVVPKFIHDQGADVIIAGGMGPRAIELFHSYGIDVVTGAIGQAERVLSAYFEGSLSGVFPCSHSNDQCQGHTH